MKTRIELAGGAYRSDVKPEWVGELPFMPGINHGMCIVVAYKNKVDGEEITDVAFKVSGVTLEINISGDTEQVLYVQPISNDHKRLMEE